MPRGTAFSIPLFDRFLLNCWSQLGSPKTNKSLKFYLFYIFLVKSAFRSWDRFLMRFWCQLGSILPPKIRQNPPQNGSQEPSIFSSISTSIFERFGSQLGTILDPKMEPKWRKNRCKNRSIFWCFWKSDFWWILVDFGRFWKPKWSQVGTNIGSNRDLMLR